MAVNIPIPPILANADVMLYQIGEDGNPIMEDPVWAGSVKVNDLALRSNHQTVMRRPTGARYGRSYAVDESHEIQIKRLWEIRVNPDDESTAANFEMTRNARYILVIAWRSEGQFEDRWFARIYYGVTAESFDIQSNEIWESDDTKVFRAEYYRELHGSGAFPEVWECA